MKSKLLLKIEEDKRGDSKRKENGKIKQLSRLAELAKNLKEAIKKLKNPSAD